VLVLTRRPKETSIKKTEFILLKISPKVKRLSKKAIIPSKNKTAHQISITFP
jgi:hypothetical protein